MRIAIVGNSHAGPVYTAWKEYKKQGGPLDAGFFIERSMAVAPLELVAADGSTLRFDDMKILPEPRLPVADYDAFVVVGLGVGFEAVVALYGQVRSDAHHIEESLQLVSDSCFGQTARDVMAATKAARTIAALASITAAPIALVPQPYSAEWIREFEGPTGDLYRAVEANGDAEVLRADYLAAAGNLGEQVRLIHQAPGTVVEHVYTSRSFMRWDPAGDAASSSPAYGDYFHGNVTWAATVVDRLHSELA